MNYRQLARDSLHNSQKKHAATIAHAAYVNAHTTQRLTPVKLHPHLLGVKQSSAHTKKHDQQLGIPFYI
jgi:hypothetical protein